MMNLSNDLFNALISTLTPLLETESERRRRFDAAFHGDAALRGSLDPHAETPRQYTWRLVRHLEGRRAGEEGALQRYVEAARQEAGEDAQVDLAATLGALATQLRGYERLRERLLAEGQDPTHATMEDAIRLSLDDLRLRFAQELRRYVDLSGARARSRGAALPPEVAAWTDPLAALGISLVELEGSHGRGQEASEPVASVREALLAVRRGVLLGEPGSGKTFTLTRVALDSAAIWQGERADPVAGRAPRVPVLVKVNAFSGRDGEGREQRFADYAREHLGPLAPFEVALRGRLVWLLDGLNEMPRRGPGGRDLLAELLAFLRPDERTFLVSCRVRDYREALAPLGTLERLELHELTPPQIRELVTLRLDDGGALWKAMGGSDELLGFWRAVGEKELEGPFWEPGFQWETKFLIGHFDGYQAWRRMHAQGARLIPLGRNPFMAYLLCELYRARKGQLPSSRAELFGSFVKVLLQRERRSAAARGEGWPEDGEMEGAMVRLATAMQARQGTVLPREAALKALAAPDGARLLDAALAATLLVEEADDARSLRFSHQLLQEYFAARELLRRLEAWEGGGASDAAALFGATWWEAGVWGETVVMLGEFLGEGARGANRVARWLAAASPEVALSVILRNATGLTVDDVERDTRAALVDSARARRDEDHPHGRAAAYRALALLDADERPGIGVRADGLPDIAWVRLEGGEFPIGGDDEALETLKAQTVKLEAFSIARYPVTNAQWSAFVEAPDGYGNERWWREAGVPTLPPEEPRWLYGNHPREGVNWYEAAAFCRWLTARLGYEVRLPTEEEWERAARGEEARIYPWGNEWDATKANTREAGPGQTSAVGLYPGGATPEGVHDLAGNILEWTASLYDPQQIDITSARVLRGSSWNLVSLAARAGARLGPGPAYRIDYRGFRVVGPAVVPL